MERGVRGRLYSIESQNIIGATEFVAKVLRGDED